MKEKKVYSTIAKNTLELYLQMENDNFFDNFNRVFREIYFELLGLKNEQL